MINVILRKIDVNGVPIVRAYAAAVKATTQLTTTPPLALLQLFDAPTAFTPIAAFTWEEVVGYDVIDAGTV